MARHENFVTELEILKALHTPYSIGDNNKKFPNDEYLKSITNGHMSESGPAGSCRWRGMKIC
jgi:hypothetical protein